MTQGAEPPPVTAPAAAPPDALPSGLRRYLSAPLLAVALLAALVHIAPFWAAQLQTPPGWQFVGNLNGSPDEMQYRVLMERTRVTGPVVDNRMTTEPNRPHIAMFFYWGIQKTADALGARPAFVYQYAGVAITIGLALLLFGFVGRFVASRYQAWWVFLTLFAGGGLGAHLMLLNEVDRLRGLMPFRRIVTDGLREATVFEEYRNHYIFTTLFDTHFLFFVVAALLAVAALYAAVKRFTVARMLVAAFAFGAVTVLHIYDGVTLLCIAAGVVAMLWLRGLPWKPAFATLVTSGVAVAAALLWQVLLYNRSGIVIPEWRANSILFSELALAYPLAWGLIAWGLGRYWKSAGVDECFLLGWIVGCTALTLSGPFYPYSDRGTLTLQVPLMIVAGAVYFAWRPRVPWRHALVAVAVLGATPVWQAGRLWINRSFSRHPSGAPPAYTWMNPDHQRLVTAMRAHAGPADALIVDKVKVPWRTDDLWLTEGFPGRLYAGHYALTPDYERRRDEINAFYTSADTATQAAFLRNARVTLVYVRGDQDPARFERIPGLRALERTPTGTLFAYAADATPQ
ncbi:MAG: hypothetical protein ACKVZ0_07175 [Gemmatimonadales bacterium]